MRYQKGGTLLSVMLISTAGLVVLAGGAYLRYYLEHTDNQDKRELIGMSELIAQSTPSPEADVASKELTKCALQSGRGYCFMSPKNGREMCVSYEANCLSLRAAESHDIGDCDQIGDGTVELAFKSSCYGAIAGFKKDKSLCDKAPSRDGCYSGYFAATDDVSVCGLIGDETSRDTCYGFGAMQTKDRAMCDLVVSQSFRATCIGSVDALTSAPVSPDSEFASWKTERSIYGIDVAAKFQYPQDWFVVGVGAASFADKIDRTFLINFSSHEYARPQLGVGEYRIVIADFKKLLKAAGIEGDIRTIVELKQKIWEGGSGGDLVDFQGNPLKVVSQQERTINGFPAFDLEVQGKGELETSRGTYILDGNGTVLIFSREGDLSVEQMYFEKILSTFRFLK